MDFPEVGRGTYILLLHLAKPTTCCIGMLGLFDFPSGYYAYVGSALHSSGLRGRLKHHLGPIRHPHWHIDYLRETAFVEQVWYSVSSIPFEHKWASCLAFTPGAHIPVRRFGASDCTCQTHLFYFENSPDFSQFCTLISEQDTIKRWINPAPRLGHE